jgi:hypothetical protein
MGTFDLNLDELVENAEFEEGLNKVIKDIIKENSYQLINQETHEYLVGLSILNTQVVGAETN